MSKATPFYLAARFVCSLESQPSRVSPDLVSLMPEKNSSIYTYNTNMELSLPTTTLKISSSRFRATQSYQQNITSIEIFASQNLPKLPG